MATKAEQFKDGSVLNEVLSTIKALEKMKLCFEDGWIEQKRALISIIEDKTAIDGPPTFVRQLSMNSLNASRNASHKKFHKMTSASSPNITNNDKHLDSCDDYGLGYGLDESACFDDSDRDPRESTKILDEFNDPSIKIDPSTRGLGNQPAYVASQLCTMP